MCKISNGIPESRKLPCARFSLHAWGRTCGPPTWIARVSVIVSCSRALCFQILCFPTLCCPAFQRTCLYQYAGSVSPDFLKWDVFILLLCVIWACDQCSKLSHWQKSSRTVWCVQLAALLFQYEVTLSTVNLLRVVMTEENAGTLATKCYDHFQAKRRQTRVRK